MGNFFSKEAKEQRKQKFLSTLKDKLSEKGYRSDLKLVTSAKYTSGTFNAEVRFSPNLGHPSENDLLSIVAQLYPEHEINWELLDMPEDEAGIINLVLQPSVEVIPVKNIKEIPSDFVPIGSAIYKRAVDASGNVNEIWTLKKTDDGLALFRNNDDLEIQADEEVGFKAGDVVDTPQGPGVIKRMDEDGNAFVQIGSKLRMVAQMDLKKYELGKEQKKLIDYYTQVYGPEFAKELVKDYSTNKD